MITGSYATNPTTVPCQVAYDGFPGTGFQFQVNVDPFVNQGTNWYGQLGFNVLSSAFSGPTGTYSYTDSDVSAWSISLTPGTPEIPDGGYYPCSSGKNGPGGDGGSVQVNITAADTYVNPMGINEGTVLGGTATATCLSNRGTPDEVSITGTFTFSP